MKKKNKKWIILVIGIWMLCIFNSFSADAKELKLYARSALLMDASNGRVLYEENGYACMPNASTTKIMTCILALEYLENQKKINSDTMVECAVSEKAARMPKVHLGMKAGDRYYLEDLLYSLMLESHNDTAMAIAETVAGSKEAFADRMNQKAAELGCKDTYFVTPNGLDEKRNGRAHSTTAYDLGKIAAYAIQNPKFCEIIKTPVYSFYELNQRTKKTVYNKDIFLNMMEEAIGIKTGFTNQAGYCFVGACKKGEKTLISVVLASGWPPHKGYKWEDTKKLMQYGLEEFDVKEVTAKQTKIPITVRDGTKDRITAKTKRREEKLKVLLGPNERIRMEYEILPFVNAPVHKGECVGYEVFRINGNLYKKYPILVQESVELRSYFYCIREIFMLYFMRMRVYG